jgi:hypothetical protein
MTLSLCLGESDSCQDFISIFYNSRHHTSLSIGTLGCLPVALPLGLGRFPSIDATYASLLLCRSSRLLSPLLLAGLSLWVPELVPDSLVCRPIVLAVGVRLWDGPESLVRADSEQASVQAGTRAFELPVDLGACWRAVCALCVTIWRRVWGVGRLTSQFVYIVLTAVAHSDSCRLTLWFDCHDTSCYHVFRSQRWRNRQA